MKSMKVNCSFEKEKKFCHCIDKYTHTFHYTGLISTNSARQKPQTMSKKQSVHHQEPQKKLSLKSRKRSLKQSPERFNLPKEFQTKNNKSESHHHSGVKQTRGWMEKKKALIQIQSICRVPTKQLFKKNLNQPCQSSINNLTFGVKNPQTDFIFLQSSHEPTKNPQFNYRQSFINKLSTNYQTEKNRRSLKTQSKTKHQKKLKEIDSVIDQYSWEDNKISSVAGKGCSNFMDSSVKEDKYPTFQERSTSPKGHEMEPSIVQGSELKHA